MPCLLSVSMISVPTDNLRPVKVAPPDNFDTQINLIETLDLLAYAEKKYQGVTRLGIEALKLKLEGMSVSEIASLYHVPPPHVGAWISRAAKKLRSDTPFLSGLL